MKETLCGVSPFNSISLHLHPGIASSLSPIRQASSRYLDFFRLDYPEVDPPKWQKWVTVRLEDGNVRTGELPVDFWGSLEEDCKRHR
jgi:hypothetical protein